MNSRKLYFVLIGLLVLLGVGLLEAMHLTSGMFAAKSKQLVDLKAQQQAATESQTLLARDKRDIAAYADLNGIARTVVPQDKNQAAAVQEIVNLANQSGISQLSSISFPPSTLGGAHAKAGGGLTQVTPVTGISGVYQLQITISQSSATPVTYSSFASFLAKLEQNRRTAQVTSITIQPDPKNASQVAFTLVVNEFIKP